MPQGMVDVVPFHFKNTTCVCMCMCVYCVFIFVRFRFRKSKIINPFFRYSQVVMVGIFLFSLMLVYACVYIFVGFYLLST